MPPNSTLRTGVLFETDPDVPVSTFDKDVNNPEETRYNLVWKNVFLFLFYHASALYGVYLMFTEAKLITTVYAFIMAELGGFGITAGVHRLWAHKAYKASWQLRLFLMLLNTMAFQDPVIHWARDHRLHHKFSESDADPHNAKRGFFFCHVGWLMCRKHPQVTEKGKQIDVSDLWADPILKFQYNYYNFLMPLFCFVLPTAIPVYFWGETLRNAFYLNIFRYCYMLNCTWLVNSAAHFWGNRPYDKYIYPRQNIVVAILALGEGWHNFHHAFPWDYKTAELGTYSFNMTNAFIDFFAKIGWAYDLKTVSPELVKRKTENRGDGSHEIWGWGDKDQPQEDYDGAIITHRKDL